MLRDRTNLQASFLEPLSLLPSKKTSIRLAQKSYDPSVFLQDFDRVQVLGSDATGYGDSETYGHEGCVNACAWNQDGDMLASGSDDFRICVWKMGQDPIPTAGEEELEGQWPKLGMDLQTVVYTGHTRNIFSVKWSPYCNSSRLISCAGDRKVKVFDISRTAEASIVTFGHRSRSEFTPDLACIRTFKCHTDRVKRISLEDSADVFLTCSEDGTVRQHDLRAPHTCPRCPAPLADYSSIGTSLYTLTSSSLRPELFVCAGTAPYAYLHDRRMINRTMMAQWGVAAREGLTTQCVRRFGLVEGAQRSDHIVACKMSEANGRELLVSFSGGPVALFYVDGEVYEYVKEKQQGKKEGKRRRSAESSLDAPVRKSEKLDDSEEKKKTILADLDTGLSQDQLDDLASLRPQVTSEDWFILANVFAAFLENGPSKALQLMENQHLFHQDPFVHLKADMQILVEEPEPGIEEAVRTLMIKMIRLYADNQTIQPEAEQAGFQVDLDEEGQVRVTGFESTDEEDEDFEEMSVDESESAEEEEEETEPPVPISDSRRRAQEMKDALAAVPLVTPKQTYSGHRNIETVKDVNFGFAKDAKVMSGSDDGRLFIWNKESGEIEHIFEGDSSVVNVMTTHPRLPVLACSGIDNSIKIFAPTTEERKKYSALKDKEQIVQQNATRTRRNPGGVMIPPTRALMAFLARRMRAQEAEAEEDGGQNPGVVSLRQEDIDDLMAEGGMDECCIS